MKMTDCRKKAIVPFVDIDYGECFDYDNELFMKISTDEESTAIRVKSGTEWKIFDPDTITVPLEVNLIITGFKK